MCLPWPGGATARASAVGNAVAVGISALLVDICVADWWDAVRDEKLLSMSLFYLPVFAASYFEYLYVQHTLPERCDEPLFVLAAHHKSGSDLAKALAKASRMVFGDEVRVVMWMRHWRNHSCTAMRSYGCIDREALRLIRSSGRPYKMVHFVRDPLKLVISAYWYHLRSYDTQLVLGTGPDVLRKLGTLEGLELEAQAELESTLQEILEVVEDSAADPRVLTLGLEDFFDDFNSTARRIFSFLLGPHHHPELQGLLDAAAGLSENRKDNSLQNRQRAMDLIGKSGNPVWDRVRGLRPAFGYEEVTPGRFRRPFHERLSAGALP